ncbi:uncharacterized protein MONOS_11667 [Monocercomonoides exilis]|uniref:uncharacterized protein n=1 Tax=Monocercomonoides exilis TaxID=2049356 RepID=UPI00355A28B3|nr:hypothetical protein MONOS_11667 [Monocercomonoides exilis]|eukprot:MONOS_11667.1-p1 / transcript=MONOS_11667.1 / gene=MONOS_11667 / organism=Monocercomonoides_exilis_PA203 / gene_product=unspecified product / transcript_product=unspecified product / location=Mono_scaffold00599:16122-21224(-) / protein_length=1522 / sequence_SO=supercontig / SO=protein_coding / is_pseudo=false
MSENLWRIKATVKLLHQESKKITKLSLVGGTSELLAEGFESGQVNLINIKSGTLSRAINAHTEEVTALSSIEKFLVSGSANAEIKLWDPETGNCITSLPAFQPYKRISYKEKKKVFEYVKSLNYASSLPPLTTSSNSVPQAESPSQSTKVMNEKQEYLSSLVEKFNHQGYSQMKNKLAVRLFGIGMDESSHQGRIQSICFCNQSYFGRRLMSSSASRSQDTQFPSSSALANVILCSASSDKTVKLWSLDSSPKLLHSLQNLHTDTISCILNIPSTPYVITAGWDRAIKVVDLRHLRLVCSFEGAHSDFITSLVLLPHLPPSPGSAFSDTFATDIMKKARFAVEKEKERREAEEEESEETFSEDGLLSQRSRERSGRLGESYERIREEEERERQRDKEEERKRGNPFVLCCNDGDADISNTVFFASTGWDAVIKLWMFDGCVIVPVIPQSDLFEVCKQHVASLFTSQITAKYANLPILKKKKESKRKDSVRERGFSREGSRTENENEFNSFASNVAEKEDEEDNADEKDFDPFAPQPTSRLLLKKRPPFISSRRYSLANSNRSTAKEGDEMEGDEENMKQKQNSKDDRAKEGDSQKTNTSAQSFISPRSLTTVASSNAQSFSSPTRQSSNSMGSSFASSSSSFESQLLSLLNSETKQEQDERKKKMRREELTKKLQEAKKREAKMAAEEEKRKKIALFMAEREKGKKMKKKKKESNKTGKNEIVEGGGEEEGSDEEDEIVKEEDKINAKSTQRSRSRDFRSKSALGSTKAPVRLDQKKKMKGKTKTKSEKKENNEKRASTERDEDQLSSSYWMKQYLLHRSSELESEKSDQRTLPPLVSSSTTSSSSSSSTTSSANAPLSVSLPTIHSPTSADGSSTAIPSIRSRSPIPSTSQALHNTLPQTTSTYSPSSSLTSDTSATSSAPRERIHILPALDAEEVTVTSSYTSFAATRPPSPSSSSASSSSSTSHLLSLTSAAVLVGEAEKRERARRREEMRNEGRLLARLNGEEEHIEGEEEKKEKEERKKKMEMRKRNMKRDVQMKSMGTSESYMKERRDGRGDMNEMYGKEMHVDNDEEADEEELRREREQEEEEERISKSTPLVDVSYSKIVGGVGDKRVVRRADWMSSKDEHQIEDEEEEEEEEDKNKEAVENKDQYVEAETVEIAEAQPDELSAKKMDEKEGGEENVKEREFFPQASTPVFPQSPRQTEARSSPRMTENIKKKGDDERCGVDDEEGDEEQEAFSPTVSSFASYTSFASYPLSYSALLPTLSSNASSSLNSFGSPVNSSGMSLSIPLSFSSVLSYLLLNPQLSPSLTFVPMHSFISNTHSAMVTSLSLFTTQTSWPTPLVCSGSADGTVSLWSAEKGKRMWNSADAAEREMFAQKIRKEKSEEKERMKIFMLKRGASFVDTQQKGKNEEGENRKEEGNEDEEMPFGKQRDSLIDQVDLSLPTAFYGQSLNESRSSSHSSTPVDSPLSTTQSLCDADPAADELQMPLYAPISDTISAAPFSSGVLLASGMRVILIE